ncbi:hypothetical protein HMPREF9144_0031 [Prevotella pallens ATCC 700821]|uniref:Uncharacterized protein n=2 Tax=Prevotella pallens TaxID=60133 RepID=F9DEE1_9BACT|nr:hypothetical protein HMPREF9144_0031 [Prevotella pallens ATCC 700821]RAS46647.1 hypothetical protein BC673_10533 [Prevotella pallens]
MVTLSLLISVCKQVFLRSKEGQQSFILRETNFVLSLMAGAKIHRRRADCTCNGVSYRISDTEKEQSQIRRT